MQFEAKYGYHQEDLLQSSLHHLRAASILFRQGPDLYDSGGYLLHLSIELLLKSWLLALTGKFPGTHQLQDLTQRIAKVGGVMKLSKVQNKTIELIDRFYELRYPNRRTPTEVGSESFELAVQLYETLYDRLPDDVKQEYANLPRAKKSGRILMKKPVGIPTNIDFLLDKPAKHVARRQMHTSKK